MTIQHLLDGLLDLESRRAYPPGIKPFPRLLTGQAFFPGGDGLWREPNKLEQPSQCPFPTEGVMVLGNDFGTLQSFYKLRTHEDVPTWRHTRRRLIIAGIRGEDCFFTNAYLGLRTDRAALAKGMDDSDYDGICAEFLEFQLSVQRPRLIIALKDRCCRLLELVLDIQRLKPGQAIQVRTAWGRTVVLQTSHPYSDQFNAEGSLGEGERMGSAWRMALGDTTAAPAVVHS